MDGSVGEWMLSCCHNHGGLTHDGGAPLQTSANHSVTSCSLRRDHRRWFHLQLPSEHLSQTFSYGRMNG